MVLGNLLGGVAGGATVAIVIKAVDEFSNTFNKAGMGMKGLATALTAGVAVAGAAAAAITAVGVASLKQAASFEQSQIAFETMLGSAEQANAFLEELSAFAKRTPFTLPGVEQAAKQLMAVGFEAKDVLPTLKSVGDISSGLGMGEEGLRRLILNLGQVRNQGKLTGRELRDFAIAGVPLLDELANSMGKTKKEIQAMVSKGDVSFDDVINSFKNMTSEGGKFANLMDKQSKSLIGQWSNIKDSLILIAREIGMSLLPVIKELADVILKDFLPPLKEFAPLIGTTMSTAIKTVVPFIKELLTWFIQWGKYLFDKFAPTIKPIMQGISEVFKIYMGIIRELFEKVVPKAIPIIEKLVAGFIKMADMVIQQLLPAIRPLGKVFIELIGIVLDLADTFITNMLPVLIDLIPLIVTIVKQFIKFLQSLVPVVKFVSLLASVMMTLLAPILSVVVKLVTFFLDMLIGISDILKNSLIGLMEKLGFTTEDFGNIYESVTKSVKQLSKQLFESVDFMADSVDDVLSWLGDGFLEFADIVYNVASTIAKSIGNAMSKAVDGIKSLGSSIWGAIKDIISRAYNWGKDMINNMASGIYDAIKDLGRRAKRWFKDHVEKYLSFDIRANDKMAYNWGKDMITFFTKGIQSLDMSSLNLNPQSAALSAAPTSTGASIGDINISVNANVNNDTDIDKLAREIGNQVYEQLTRR